jgi:putative oxidoreductase
VILSILIFLAITACAGALAYLSLARVPRAASPLALKGLEWLCRLGLAGVFIYAAWSKLFDPYAFASNTYAYRLVPPPVATVTGITLPAVEIVAALAMLTGVLWRGGVLLLAGMLAFFVFAVFQAILRGIDIHCGCFGKASHPVSFLLIAQDQLLLVGCLFLLWVGHLRDQGRPGRGLAR